MELSQVRQRRALLILGIALLAAVLVGSLAITLWGRTVAEPHEAHSLGALPTPPPPAAGTPINPPRPMPDWTLTGTAGQPVRLSDLRGKAVLLFFGYSSCPDACPTTLADFAQVRRNLGSAGERLALVFVSVDPQRDTPERLARYVTTFDPAMIGATGDDATLQAMGAPYGLYFERHEGEGTNGNYPVDHSTASYLIDPQGRERVIYGLSTPPAVIAKDIQAILAE